MNRSCQLGGNLAFISTKSGPYGISNLISNSGGRSPLATTAVGMTSICGIRIFPDLRTLFYIFFVFEYMLSVELVIKNKR